MVTRPVVIAVICVGFFLILESLVPKAMALKTSNINDFRMEDQRTHKRNYVAQRARDKDILGSLENIGVTYETDSARNPEELSAFIVDYANMIDDVILLDKSVETRTRKRGNIKLEKYNNQAILDPPCSCKTTKDPEFLGENTFPRHVVQKICDKEQRSGCVAPYICQEIYYNIPVLRMKTPRNADSSRIELIPQNLNVSWVAELKPISVGCECKRDYKFTN